MCLCGCLSGGTQPAERRKEEFGMCLKLIEGDLSLAHSAEERSFGAELASERAIGGGGQFDTLASDSALYVFLYIVTFATIRAQSP